MKTSTMASLAVLMILSTVMTWISFKSEDTPTILKSILFQIVVVFLTMVVLADCYFGG